MNNFKNTKINPLKSDPKRQAIPVLEGYLYQIWQSVYEWITLKENETLYLEGAEDIDKLQGGKAITIQVKDTKDSGNITLNTQSVIDAINHYWDHQEQNKNMEIRFRFLTTSDRGKEKDKPFGDINGLDYWDKCKNHEVVLEPLRKYLLKKNLIKSLCSFLESTSNDSIINKFIKRIDWDTGREERKELKTKIIRKLVFHGNGLSIPIMESTNVCPHLLDYVWEKICNQQRGLDYIEFLEIFEKKTSISIPVSQVRNILPSNLQNNLFANLLIKDAGSQFFNLQIEDSIYPIYQNKYDKYVSRLTQIKDVNKILDNFLICNIIGSSGTGKSVLADLIAISQQEEWIKLVFRGLSDQEAKILLIKLFELLIIKGFKNIVFDDFQFSNFHVVKHEFCLLYNLLMDEKKQIIITSQNSMPSSIKIELELDDECIFRVPFFNEKDIKELAQKYQCKSIDIINLWTPFIQAQTQGHPQLVHAKIINLSNKNWKKPTIDELFISKDIEPIKRDVRKQLIDDIKSDDAKTLAYRLSLINQRFRRDHAIALASKLETIKNPGERFDELVGPWIEQTDETHFRISPLISGIANKIYDQKEITKIHHEIAFSFYECGKISQTEVSGILLHGMLGQAALPLLATVQTLLSLISTDSRVELLLRELSWFSYVCLEPVQKIFYYDIHINLLLRLLQFKIASELNSSDAVTQIIDIWGKEIDELNESIEKFSMQLIHLSSPLFYFQGSLPIKIVINNMVKLDELSIKYDTSNEKLIKSIKKLFSLDNLIIGLVVRIKNIYDLKELIQTTNLYPTNIIRKILKPLKTDFNLSDTMISQTYVSIKESEDDDWSGYLLLLNNLIEFSIILGLDALTIVTFRYIAIIYEEDLKTTKKAIEVLDRSEKQFNRLLLPIQEYRALIFLRNKKYQLALDIYQQILPDLIELNYVISLHTCSYAERCSGFLNKWELALKYTIFGIKAARRLKSKNFLYKFEADYAFSQWKIGKYEKAINVYAHLLKSLDRLPNPNSNLDSYVFHKRLSHAIAWSLQNLDGNEILVEPGPAFFTEVNYNESIKDYPIMPSIFTWQLLSIIEYKVTNQLIVFQEFYKRGQDLKYPVIRLFMHDLKIKHKLKVNNFDDLITDYIELIKYKRIYSKVIKSNDAIWQEVAELEEYEDVNLSNIEISTLLDILILEILCSTNISRSIVEIINNWQRTRHLSSFNLKRVQDWIRLIPEITNNPNIILYDVNELPENRVLAAVFISISKNYVPIQRFYADIILFDRFVKNNWGEIAEPHLEKIILNGWQYVVDHQKFHLQLPKINVPLLQSAINNNSISGFKKIAKILHFANDTVNLKVPDDILKKIEAFL